MPRSRFAMPAALCIVVLAAACSAGAAPDRTTGSAPSAPVATAAASHTASSPSPAATPTAAPTPFAVGEGEPWLLFNAFVANDRKAAYLVRPDGTSIHQILTGVIGDVRALSWSPDGRQLVFAVRDSATPDGSIWTADADGSNAQALYDGRDDGCGAVYHPRWSPDGKRLAFVCYQGHAGSPELPNAAVLAVLDPPTRAMTTLATTHWPDWLDNPPVWSPDGRTIAYDVLHWDPTNTRIDGSRIATVASDGSGKPVPLNERDSFAAYPGWSPDGSRIVYNTDDIGNMADGGPSNLYTMAADGTDVVQVTDASTGPGYRIATPRWEPDGSRIWVTLLADGNVKLGWVDPATGVVTELPVKGSRPEPRPLP